MEIIHVVLGKANPARMNGVNRVVHELATRQALSHRSVQLWGLSHDLCPDHPERPYATRLFLRHANPFRLDKELLRSLDRLSGGTVLHLHGGFIPIFYSLAVALQERRLPFVFTPHGSYNHVAMEKSFWKKRLYFRLFEQKLLNYAQTIHCLGKSEMAGLQEFWPNSKTVLIPYGFELPAPCFPCALPGDFIIGFCGRLDIHTKGLDVLLEAFARFARCVPQAKLWIIGDGKGRKELELMARKLSIAGHTLFYGSRFGEEKRDLLARMHVFVHPSRNEGLPTAVLEAASLGVPCVVTEATNMGDAIRHFGCGAVIDLPHAALLSGALLGIHKVMGRDGMTRLSSNARQMVREGFDWQQVIRQFYHHLYQVV